MQCVKLLAASTLVKGNQKIATTTLLVCNDPIGGSLDPKGRIYLYFGIPKV
jgi:hypothetical protein